MHLVVIFGPPAAGKMTVGRELAALTGFKLFHNHLSIDPVIEVFDWGTPSFTRLTTEIRRRVIEEAVIAELSGLIFTFVWALDDPSDLEYVDALTRPVRASGSPVSFVELVSDQGTRLAREGTALRLAHKRPKRDVDRSKELLVRADAEHTLNTVSDFAYPDAHLVIDNSALAPDVVARRVVERFGLPGANERATQDTPVT